MNDQESYINQLKRQHEDRERNLKEQIDTLRQEIKGIAVESDEKGKEYQESNKVLYTQLENKNKEVYELHHSIITIEKENKRYKDELMGLQDHL